MDSNIDLKSLWNRQPTGVAPEVKELLQKARAWQKQSRRKLVLSAVLLMATAVFIGIVVLQYQPDMITTKIGTVIIIIAILFQVIVSGGAINFLGKYKNKDDEDNHAYLQYLLEWKKKQRFLHGTILSIYFVLLTAGLVLYMIEYAGRMQLTGRVLAYVITLIWIAFNWFYLRPRTIKKQQAKLDTLISRLTQMNEEINDH